MNNGYVKLHRKMVDWEWYTDVNVKSVFIHLILIANIKDKKWRGQVIKRGEVVTSYASLAQQIGISVKQVRIAIKKLEKSGDVASKSTNKNTLFMVLNYNLYQSTGQTKDNQKERKGQATGQTEGNQRATTKEYKEYKEIKKKRLDREKEPTLEEVLAYKKEINSNADANRFYDYNQARSWMIGNTPIQDWKALFRNWTANERQKSSPDLPDWYKNTSTERASPELIGEIKKMQEEIKHD